MKSAFRNTSSTSLVVRASMGLVLTFRAAQAHASPIQFWGEACRSLLVAAADLARRCYAKSNLPRIGFLEE